MKRLTAFDTHMKSRGSFLTAHMLRMMNRKALMVIPVQTLELIAAPATYTNAALLSKMPYDEVRVCVYEYV